MLNYDDNNKTVPVIKEKSSSVRLKVTDKCNLSCIYCHNEGKANTDDIVWTSLTEGALRTLINALNLSEVHITGGEPTCLNNIDDLVKNLTSLGLFVKITTNGQFTKAKLDSLADKGLGQLNFSVIALNPTDFIKTQNKKNLYWAQRCIERQKRIIYDARKMKAKIKLNTVVNNIQNICRVLTVYNFAKEKNIKIRLLNDLWSGQSAITAINQILENELKAKKTGEKIVLGSSSKISYYEDQDGFKFGVKEIIKNKLKSMCSNCEKSCIEEFYGIRLHKYRGRIFVMLCLTNLNEKTFLPLEDFIKSQQLEEISSICYN